MTILLEILFINSTMKQGSYSRMIIMLCCNSGCHMFILWQGEMKKNVFLQLDMCVQTAKVNIIQESFQGVNGHNYSC